MRVSESTDTINNEGVIGDGRLEALLAAPWVVNVVISIVDRL